MRSLTAEETLVITLVDPEPAVQSPVEIIFVVCKNHLQRPELLWALWRGRDAEAYQIWRRRCRIKTVSLDRAALPLKIALDVVKVHRPTSEIECRAFSSSRALCTFADDGLDFMKFVLLIETPGSDLVFVHLLAVLSQ